jgi:hypothetical protein
MKRKGLYKHRLLEDQSAVFTLSFLIHYIIS